MWLSFRSLTKRQFIIGRRVVGTIMASNHKQLKMSENARHSIIKKSDSLTPFYFGTSDFSQIVKSPAFIDKTLMLEEVVHGNGMVLITAPRRFAKSTNMDMVKKFVEIEVDEAGVVINREESPNRKIFYDNNLLIYQDKAFFDRHFATYPVIRTSFKMVRANSYDEVLNRFRSILRDTYSEHKYLLKSHIWSQYHININAFKRYYDVIECETLDKNKIIKGFEFLSECLYYHFGEKQVFVLIDEYDAPINSTMLEKEIDINRVNELLTCIFLTTLKENMFVERALLTGVSYIAIVSLTGAINPTPYAFLDGHRFVKYYGLIESEVDALLSKFKIDDENINEVKSYYDGYYSTDNVKLYPLWSMLHYLQTKQLVSYWQKYGIVSDLQKALRFLLIQMSIEKLLKNESIKIWVFDNISLDDVVDLQDFIFGRTNKTIHNPDLFWNFLLRQGYLTYEGSENIFSETSVRIPNNEIRDELIRELNTFYGPSLTRLFDECSAAFNQISVSDIESF